MKRENLPCGTMTLSVGAAGQSRRIVFMSIGYAHLWADDPGFLTAKPPSHF